MFVFFRVFTLQDIKANGGALLVSVGAAHWGTTSSNFLKV